MDIPLPSSQAPVNQSKEQSPKLFPYNSTLSLVPLIEYWQQALEEGNAIDGLLALRVMEQVRLAPELYDPIHDLSALAPHKEVVELLMTAIFPPALGNDIIGAAIAPYRLKPIYATPKYHQFISEQGKELFGSYVIDHKTHFRNQVLFACSLILDKCYGLNLLQEAPILFHTVHPESGLDRYFKSQINARFAKIICPDQNDPPRLDKGAIRQLLNNMDDIDLWLRTLSPKSYAFEGIVILNLLEMTEEEMLSSLKYDLLARDAFVSEKRKMQIIQKLRSLFHDPELKVGLCLMNDYEIFGHLTEEPMWGSLCSDHKSPWLGDNLCVLHRQVITHQKPHIVDDLDLHPEASSINENLRQQGIRNLILAPLCSEQGVIGILELGSSKIGSLTALSAIKLSEILPIFTVAIERYIKELLNSVQAIIKEKYTTIHPTVAWRFNQAAVRHLENPTLEPEQIIFENVYPLYAISDIRDSSSIRNHAIQSDLIQQLSLAQQVIQEALSIKDLPLLERLNHRIQKQRTAIEEALSFGDEVAILEMIRDEIDPVFIHLRQHHPRLERIIQLYDEALDSKIGLVYKRRKQYEESLNLINATLSRYLDQQEAISQRIFPHYFSKNQTDGVEYDIYVGNSIVPGRHFDLMDLQNLRLWQLKITSEMARIVANLKHDMPIPMDIAHLIYVHSTSLDIKFRMDEKRFDVDGAYNVQYQIIKKRIDKSYIKHTTKRLTQPGTISIVYSHPRIEQEYKTYITYLQEKEYLEPDISYFEVESMQGVKGLKAMRVKANLFHPISTASINVQEIF